MKVEDTAPKPFMVYFEEKLGEYRYIATIQKVHAFLALALKEMGSQYATIFATQSAQFKGAIAVLTSHGCITEFKEAWKARDEYVRPEVDVDSRRLYKLADKIVVALSMIGFAISLLVERALGWACMLDTVHNVFALGMAVEDISCAVAHEHFEIDQEVVDVRRRDAAYCAKRLNMLKAGKAITSLAPGAIAATTAYTGLVLSPMCLAVIGVVGAFLAVRGDLYGNNMAVKVDLHALSDREPVQLGRVPA